MLSFKKVNHYTNIESLDKILENKKIRFKRFDLMDDQTENEGVPEILKKNFFLSCWSKESREMIPQWAMYAQNGIRIELPLKWYINHQIPVDGGNSISDFTKVLDLNHPARNTFFPIPFHEIFKDKYIITPPLNCDDGFILEVEYSNNFKEIKQLNWEYDPIKKITHLHNLHSLILYKDEYWDFQKEIRYYFHTVCKDADQNYLPEYFDIPINPIALDEIKITLYPNCTQEHELKVIEICQKYLENFNSETHIKRSVLDGKYKPKQI